MRIPTLLGIALLLIAIFLGVGLYYLNNQGSPLTTSPQNPPQNISVLNITSNMATITWETDSPTQGLVSWGDSDSLGNSQNDIRDQEPASHYTHFVTITNLKPDTLYFYKIRSNLNFYTDKNLQFTTAHYSQTADKNQAIFGTILDPNLKPVDEALVVMQSDQTADIATLSTGAGNFLLPLINLKSKDLTSEYTITDKLPAQLTIYYHQSKQIVKFTLPLKDKPLPKIIIGQDNDFTQLTATLSAQLNSSPSAIETNPYDINTDGKVNALDLLIIEQNLGKKSTDQGFNPKADLNHDGIINQFDVEIERKALR